MEFLIKKKVKLKKRIKKIIKFLNKRIINKRIIMLKIKILLKKKTIRITINKKTQIPLKSNKKNKKKLDFILLTNFTVFYLLLKKKELFKSFLIQSVDF